jgi:hypothetical protein
MNRLRHLNKKVLAKIGRKILDVRLFIKYLLRSSKAKNELVKPAIYLDLEGNSYVRYSYILSKYFEIEGYTVYFKPGIRFMLSLGAPYARLIFEEHETRFSNTIPPKMVVAFSDRKKGRAGFRPISNDYFSTIYAHDPTSYHIPIGMHPNMYKLGLWNAPVKEAGRVQSIFFAGSFNEVEYKRLANNSKFKMLDRLSLGRQLKKLPNTSFPETHADLMANRRIGQIDIVDKAFFSIPMDLLRQTISGYAYFIACPGVDMPLSHNVIEAMSVGTIPIIHQAYAKMFSPELEDYKDAITYEDSNFSEKLAEAIALPADKVEKMNENVKAYYEANLTPKAVVANMINPKYERFFMNAERTSVGIMK